MTAIPLSTPFVCIHDAASLVESASSSTSAKSVVYELRTVKRGGGSNHRPSPLFVYFHWFTPYGSELLLAELFCCVVHDFDVCTSLIKFENIDICVECFLSRVLCSD